MFSPEPAMGLVRTPKRNAIDLESRSSWFTYYASFSSGFVQDFLGQLDLRPGATLLDPWLGAGTTAEAALHRGLRFKGYDINPSMVLVAKARTLSKSNAPYLAKAIQKCTGEFERHINTVSTYRGDTPFDLLEHWLQPRSAHAFRNLERIIANLDRTSSSVAPAWSRTANISATTSTLYVALFRTLRHFISNYRSSNPTWIKVSEGGPRVHVSYSRILARFAKETSYLQNALNAEQRIWSPVESHRCVINQASSTNLPVRTCSIDAILSSPPYCTRIDYVRATLPELALVGYPDGAELRNLRNQMMGTPTVHNSIGRNNLRWGPTCIALLSIVESHYSKASSTYYLKYFRQYFDTTLTSLIELHRVLKRSGYLVVVVQNSYYKDVLIDLAAIFGEMGKSIGFKQIQRLDFTVARTLAGIHPQAKRYRKDFGAIESVLTFQKR